MPINHGQQTVSKIDANTRIEKLNDSLVPDLLFRQVEKPKNLCSVKAINVFENRYRINIWVSEEEDGLQKIKIGASYFARFEGEKLHIREDGCEKRDR